MASLDRTRRGKRTTYKPLSAGAITPGASRSGEEVAVSLCVGSTVFSPNHADSFHISMSESEWLALAAQVAEHIRNVRTSGV